MTILIFPCTLIAATKFAQEARNWGHKTLGASSIVNEQTAIHYDDWVELPLIGNEAFFDRLRDIVQEKGIRSIFTPHAPTFHLLQDRLAGELPKITLLGRGPFETQMANVICNLALGKSVIKLANDIAGVEGPFSPEFVGSVVAQADSIHGECAQQKMSALFAMMPEAPKGDIIEIGALYGKSSYLLNRIGTYLNIGATLAVDPWNLGLSVQLDAPVHIQTASGGWDWDVVATGFIMNMLSVSNAPFNYLRATSKQAYKQYSTSQLVESKEFGTVRYAGQISVLHLDGNHDEVAVAEDFELWSPHLAPNGWIIFDDYNWAHGDGPKIVADRALKFYGTRVKKHFVAGGAMFVNVL